MTEVLQSQILEALQAKPNQTASELAGVIGHGRVGVNKLLHGPLKGKVSQNRAYRWSLFTSSEGRARSSWEGTADSDLARLCRYYLACLGYDARGISTALTSKYASPSYYEVEMVPNSPDDLANSEACRNLMGQRRSQRGSYDLYFGYPTSIRSRRIQQSKRQELMVEPILLFPIEQEVGTGATIVDLRFPIINQRAFQSFTHVAHDELMPEITQLEHELGLTREEEQPNIDEVVMRLQAIRPEWPWKETIDPDLFSDERPPMAEIDKPGIYNRAIVLMSEREPYTQGLEKELRKLSQLPASKYADTALGKLLAGDVATPGEAWRPDGPLMEVLPMNAEQRQAVAVALTNPATIITGPPGTGKSQVVTNLLINASWFGKRVLFASKNNKAVDVVETRVNAFGSAPVLLRAGAGHQVGLAEYLLALLSSISSDAEREDYEEAEHIHRGLLEKRDLLAEESRKFVDLRNETDRLEQAAENARQQMSPELFARALDLSISEIQALVQSVLDAADEANRSRAGLFVRWFWPVFRGGRLEALSAVMGTAASSFAAIEVKLPSMRPPNSERLRDAVETAFARLGDLNVVVDYRKSLRELQVVRPLEEIAREEASLLERVSQQSAALWKLWLRIRPSKISAEDRRQLAKFQSLLKMVVEGGSKGRLSSQIEARYNKMLLSVSHLLPCWAVTSLSASARIPFNPGGFDLVVIDEASQCDIASALPLLYRAKSVAIIGDPKQLTHISNLLRGEDQALLERFNLTEDFPHWAYSYQSLFALGSTQVAADSIVNLVDHHRSHADIINFSNQEFYEERLRVATKYGNLHFPSKSEPGVRWIDVKGRVTRPSAGGAINVSEVETIVDALRELVLNRRYQGTVGAVTPFRAQANAIMQAVNRDKELESMLIERGFLADTVHKFQGDECDVMFFSPVVSSGLPDGALVFLRSNGNLFNVAITRARAQLIVVGDLSACKACDVGYLSRFARYVGSIEKRAEKAAANLLRETGPSYPKVAKPELVSDWEKRFYHAAYRADIRLIPQYVIEKYIVDFLLVADERKLAIEIDGERYHRNWTGELCRRDQIRNQRLFELGYDVMRFWVYEVRDDLAGCMRRIEEWRGSEPN